MLIFLNETHGLTKHLGAPAKDYKFGRKHKKAYDALQKSKETSQHIETDPETEPETDIETTSAESEDLEYELEDLEYDYEPSAKDTSRMSAMDRVQASMDAGHIPSPEDMDVVMEHMLRKKYK